MRDVIALLKQIREIDEVYSRQNQLAQAIPEETSKRKKVLNVFLKEFKAVQETVTNSKKEADKLDMDIKANDSQIKKLEEQLNYVKNNKEYQAILKEIQGLKQKNDALETKIVEILENEADLKEKLEKKNEEKADAEKAFAKYQAEKQAQLEKLQAELAELDKKRQALLEKMPIEVQRKYNLLSQTQSGAAIVTVVNGCCTFCYASLTPQMELEVQRQEEIVYCEACGRILVTSD